MSDPVSIVKPPPPPPTPVRNSRWHHLADPTRVVIFVHGIFSDSTSCWTRDIDGHAPVFWPDLLRDAAPEFSCYSIYLAGFETSVGSTVAGITESVDAIWDNLRNPLDGQLAPLDAAEIIFICHSTGGILVRKLLTRKFSAFAGKTVGLALYASPSLGSLYASIARGVIWFFRNDLARALQLSNPILRDLDSEFRTLLDQKTIPALFGREAYENHSPFHLFGRYRLPGPIVPRSSAAVYFPNSRLLPGTDHYTSVKPDSVNHPAHEFLRHFLFDFRQEFQLQSPTPGPSVPWRMDAFTWSISIDEEGDAVNQLEFRNVSNTAGLARFQFPPAVVDFGHMTRFTLVPGKSHPGIRLEHNADLRNDKVSATVLLPFVPTPSNPISYTIQNLDLNTYPLNIEECRRRPGHPQDGYDFIQKSLNERIDRFVFQVRFPSRIQFAESPRLEIWNENSPDSELTSRLQFAFTFFPHLGTATATIDNPPIPFIYRIAWRVAAQPPTPGPQPGSAWKQRRLNLNRALLQAAAEFFDPALAEQPLSKFSIAVRTSLTDFTALFWSLLKSALQAEPPFSPTALDVSLMCPNAADTALGLVAGFNYGVDNPRQLELAYGNGNAGRAWKQSATRVFVRRKAAHDPTGNTYWELYGQSHHEFLISVPILDDTFLDTVHAVFNIGVFEPWQADTIMNALDDVMIETLTAKAQSNGLAQLFAALQ